MQSCIAFFACVARILRTAVPCMVRHMQHGTRRRMREFVELPRSAPRRGVVPARGASEGQARATHLQKREETGLKCSSRASKE